MKAIRTTISILLTVFVTALSFTGCSEDPEISTGSISGYVTEAPGGTEPLQGVTVSIQKTGQSTTTGSDGTFKFTDLQAGNYSLQFSKSGYTTNTRTVTIYAGQTYQCDVQLSKVAEEANITLNPSSLNFGTTQTDMSVTIKNNGNTTAEWSLDLGSNNWLSASQLAGSIQAGRTQSITFTVDRNYLSEQKSIVVNFQAFGNSYPLSISCSPRNTSSEMTVSPTELNFGTTLNEKTFTIGNTGKSALNWTITSTSDALKLSATKGAISGGGNTTVVVTLDRSKINGEFSTTLIVSDGVRDQVVAVTANTSSSGGSDNPVDPSQVVVPTGLYAYFTFNGSFSDSWENKIYGYGSPEPTFAEGLTDNTKSIKFSKNDKSAFVVNEGLIDSKSMTISFWAKNISEGDIFHVTTADGATTNKMAYRDGHLKYVISSYANGSSYNFDREGNFTHKSIEDGNWHNIALVFNGDSKTTALYIDGRLMDTVSEDHTIDYKKGTKFILGGDNVPNMQIANLRIYDAKQLTANDIMKIYEAQQ